jgi:tetratricopeptide (TPR) repeat protein
MKNKCRSVAAAFCILSCLGPERGAGADAGKESVVDIAAAAQKLSDSKNFAEAAIQWRRAIELNPVFPEYRKQLGIALYSAKQYADAIRAYEEAIRLGGGTRSYSAYRIAVCYAQLKDFPKAEQWLEKAFAFGFRYIDDARDDQELAGLRDSAAFKELVGVPAPSERVAGWQHDLDFLVREIRRRSKNPSVVDSAAFQEQFNQLRSSISRRSDDEIEFELTKLMVLLGDGHSGVFGKPEGNPPAFSLPLLFFEFEEGTFLVATDSSHGELLGSQLMEIGNVKIAEAQQRFLPVISRDNDIWITQVRPYRMRSLRLLKQLGLTASDKSVELALKSPDGSLRKVTVEGETGPEIWNTLPYPPGWVGMADKLKTKPLYLKSPGKYYWFEYLEPEKVLYFQYNKVMDDKAEPLKAFAARLKEFIVSHEIKRLVIDMRWNNGGDTLLNENLLEALVQIPQLHRPGAVALITGRRTFSAATNATAFFERLLHPLIVGEPTGGKPNSAGDEVAFTLPYSKVSVNVSDTWWQSSWPYDNRNGSLPRFMFRRDSRTSLLVRIRPLRPLSQRKSIPIIDRN